jgi:hypothetical protein
MVQDLSLKCKTNGVRFTKLIIQSFAHVDPYPELLLPPCPQITKNTVHMMPASAKNNGKKAAFSHKFSSERFNDWSVMKSVYDEFKK